MSSETSAPSSGPPTVDESLVGRKVQKYDIVRVIGRGGMGMVYEALNTAIGKRVAMKFVDADVAKNKDAVARFQREAQAASAVESAHIVEIFDSGFTDDGVPFIVMELLRGEDLGHRIKRVGRLEPNDAVHIVAQILRGLHRAHEAGIVHRDLKPDNVYLVDRDDDTTFAKILDFGISKVQRSRDVPVQTLTRQGTVLGTPFYMSPEQAQALPDVDGRTDLWSVGAIFYECLTGRAPHGGGSYEQVIINICMKDVEDVRTHNPAVPEPIVQIIKRALTRERADRFATAREFLDALSAAAPGVVAPRSARGSGDESSTPGSAARTPMVASTPSDPNSFEPTVEVAGGPSRVGWSTSGRRRTASGERRKLYAVGALFLCIGGLVAFIALRKSAPATTGGETSASVVPTRPTSTNDAPPASAEVVPASTAAPQPVVTPDVSATPSASGSAKAKSPVGRAHPGPTKTAEAPATATPVTAPPQPPKKGNGVAGGLELKTD